MGIDKNKPEISCKSFKVCLKQVYSIYSCDQYTKLPIVIQNNMFYFYKQTTEVEIELYNRKQVYRDLEKSLCDLGRVVLIVFVLPIVRKIKKLKRRLK